MNSSVKKMALEFLRMYDASYVSDMANFQAEIHV